jgi:predicted membrane-bound dolichyl-phosphate-mannose-protein mannosyltransferase
MIILGDTPIGWRLFSLIFGTLTLISFYFLVKTITKDEITALASIILLSIEKMFFTFSSLAILDIFYLFFFITAILFFLKEKYLLSSIIFALSINCKLTAVFGLPIFLLLYFKKNVNNQTSIKKIIRIIGWVLSVVIFILLFLEFFDHLYADLRFSGVYSIEHIKQMVQTHTSRNWDSNIKDPPWFWLITPKNYHLGNVALIPITFIENSNPLIIGLSIISIPYQILNYHKSKDETSLMITLWTIFFYLIWFPIYFAFSRPIFNFYLLPLIPIICLSNVLFLRKNLKHLFFYILINIGIFIIFQYPFRILL